MQQQFPLNHSQLQFDSENQFIMNIISWVLHKGKMFQMKTWILFFFNFLLSAVFCIFSAELRAVCSETIFEQVWVIYGWSHKLKHCQCVSDCWSVKWDPRWRFAKTLWNNDWIVLMMNLDIRFKCMVVSYPLQLHKNYISIIRWLPHLR